MSDPQTSPDSRSFFDRITQWFAHGPFERWPWLLPLLSFIAGVASFALAQRSEGMARFIAAFALIGWPWLLAENVLGQMLVRLSRGRLPAKLLAFVTQSLQQEILFFSLPFLIGATRQDLGQIAFTGVVALGALVSTIDPLYHRRIAESPGVSVAFHAFCTFIGSLVVLPIALKMPVERALQVALAITTVWFVLSLPRMLARVFDHRMRLLGIAALVATLFALWEFRAHVPPAGLWLKDARITQSLDDLTPGEELTHISADELRSEGVIAFVAIRAPMGLAQSVTFEWWHQGERLDVIAGEIQGGNDSGWRTWSRKQNFPEDSRGRWRVDVLTPQGQLIGRLPFQVD